MILGEGYPLEVQAYFGNDGTTEAAVGILFKVVPDFVESDEKTSVTKNDPADC